jgi:hypothetical protein
MGQPVSGMMITQEFLGFYRKEVKQMIVQVGSIVEYVDHTGVSHNALLTSVWGGDAPKDNLSNGVWNSDEESPENPAPAVNLVYIDSDVSKHDPYGRQIARDTSVVPEISQTAPGNFWRLMK